MEKVSPSCEKDLQNTPQKPPKTSPKSFQNTFKNSIEKNTIFNTVFSIIWNAQNMKNVAPVEAKRYILQNRRFRKKYENNLPKHPQNHSKIIPKSMHKTKLEKNTPNEHQEHFESSKACPFRWWHLVPGAHTYSFGVLTA